MGVVVQLRGASPSKRCAGPCAQVRKLTEFYKSSHAKDGRQSRCIQCDKLHSSNRAERSYQRRDPERAEPDALEGVPLEEYSPPYERGVWADACDRTSRAYERRTRARPDDQPPVEREGLHWSTVEDLEVDRWSNEVIAMMRAGSRLGLAIDLANEELPEAFGEEDAPLGSTWKGLRIVPQILASPPSFPEQGANEAARGGRPLALVPAPVDASPPAPRVPRASLVRAGGLGPRAEKTSGAGEGRLAPAAGVVPEEPAPLSPQERTEMRTDKKKDGQGSDAWQAERTKTLEAEREKVLDALAEGPLAVSDVAAATKLDTHACRLALNSAKRLGLCDVAGMARSARWSLRISSAVASKTNTARHASVKAPRKAARAASVAPKPAKLSPMLEHPRVGEHGPEVDMLITKRDELLANASKLDAAISVLIT